MDAEGFNDNAETWSGVTLSGLLAGLCERPLAIPRPDFADALEEFDHWEAIDKAEETVKRNRRLGLPSVSKKELLTTAVTGWIDDRFPMVPALEAPKA
jgi:hypothetical protein